MNYFFKTAVRFFIGWLLVFRNIFYEFFYSGKAVKKFEGGEELVEKGYYKFNKVLDQTAVQSLRDDFRRIEAANPAGKTGQLKGRLFSNGPISDLAEKFSTRYRPMAEAYFGSQNIRCELTMYQKSWPLAERSEVPGGEFHVDDNKRNLKFFIYLTDVDQGWGPFCYVPKTHRYRGIKTLIRWLLWEIFRKRTFLYDFLLDQQELEKSEVAICGKAGTIFCADTTGYHRASIVQKGEREVFVISFTRQNLITI
jgi:hypothetical protein